jgi:ferritin-like metal-binding protein YciE
MKTTTATRKKTTAAKGAASSARNSGNGAKTTARAASPQSKTSRSKAGNAASDESDTATAGRSNTPFEKLFIDLLKDMYWAEQHLLKALPEMSNAATTDVLKAAFDDHHYQTQKHVKRLEQVFEIMAYPAEAKKCDAMEALVKEAQHIIEGTPENSMTRDAGLIIAAQKIEHYEIATYGSLVQVALTLEEDKAAYILERTLSEEEDTDQQLTDIAETQVNPMADHEDEEEQDTDLEEEEA